MRQKEWHTSEEHGKLESLYISLALLVVELKVLFAEFHLQLSQFSSVVVHVGALLVHLFLDYLAALAAEVAI